MPPKEKKSRVLGREFLVATQQAPLALSIFPVDSVQMCSYLQAEERWSAIILEPHFSAYRKGYLFHEQRNLILEEFQVSCPIQTVWNDDRSQQIISKNFTPDVYVETRLVNSDEHCVRIFVVPDVAVSAVEVAISC